MISEDGGGVDGAVPILYVVAVLFGEFLWEITVARLDAVLVGQADSDGLRRGGVTALTESDLIFVGEPDVYAVFAARAERRQGRESI